MKVDCTLNVTVRKPARTAFEKSSICIFVWLITFARGYVMV